MTIALVASAAGSGITAGMNDAGANLIVGGIGTAGGSIAPSSPTDSKGNTWTNGNELIDNVAPFHAGMFWCAAPTTDSSHTVSASVFYEGIVAMAFSGLASSPFDQQNGAISGSSSSTSLAPGSITPSVDGCLIVTYISWDSNAPLPTVTVPSGFTAGPETVSISGAIRTAMAWKIQTTAAPINPTWNYTPAGRTGAMIMSFKPASGGGGGGGSSISLAPAAGTITIASVSPILSISSTSTPGAITIPALANDTATLVASRGSLQVKIYNAATGASVLNVTAATATDGTISITNAALVQGSSYVGFIYDQTTGEVGAFTPVQAV
jgi:hypothetical protein